MKHSCQPPGLWILVVLASLVLVGPGCSRSPKVHTGVLEQAFQSAGEREADLERNAMKALRAGNGTEALSNLNEITLSGGRLTPTQRESLRDVILELQAKLLAEGKPLPTNSAAPLPTNAVPAR